MLEAIEVICLVYGVLFAAAQIFVESRPWWTEDAKHQEQFRAEIWEFLSQDEPVEQIERDMSDEELERYYPRVLYPGGRDSILSPPA